MDGCPIRAGSVICKKNSDYKDIQSVQTMCLYNTQNSAVQYCVYTMWELKTSASVWNIGSEDLKVSGIDKWLKIGNWYHTNYHISMMSYYNNDDAA